MQLSAELRWFSKEPVADLERWFTQPLQNIAPWRDPNDPRCDLYLADHLQDQLGIKRRGKKDGVEVKGLVCENARHIRSFPFVGEIEIWSKWSSNVLSTTTHPTFETNKTRWLRKFDTSNGVREVKLDSAGNLPGGAQLPARGCNVEFTKVVVMPTEDEWWSFGFESFGGLDTVVDDLESVAMEMARRMPPAFNNVLVASYPAWIKRCLENGKLVQQVI